MKSYFPFSTDKTCLRWYIYEFLAFACTELFARQTVHASFLLFFWRCKVTQR